MPTVLVANAVEIGAVETGVQGADRVRKDRIRRRTTARRVLAMLKSPNDTIAAVSTPPGEGGIGIVRLSGPDAVAIAGRIFVSSTGRDVMRENRRVFHGQVVSARDGTVDEVLLHIMRAPHSYTREDVVELNCHAGAGPVAAVLAEVLEQGARLAEPGEFTLRAFLNGRIDLIQAEAVIDHIRARTHAGLRAASAAASGVLSKELHAIRDELAEALAYVEASVDFPDDDLPELVNEPLRIRIENARERMRTLLNTAEAGRLYREGAAIAIAGRPNVGKSSLFNALLRDARAIVSAQPGTTRDRIEETITLSGVPVRLIDTAGLRQTHDEVERIGVSIARDAVQSADIILLVLDASSGMDEEDAALSEELQGLERPIWVAWNKIDLAPASPPPSDFSGATSVSALTGEGLESLEKGLAGLLIGTNPVAPEQGLLTRTHQRDSLRRGAEALDRLLAQFGESPELLSIDLRDALNAVGEVTGETTPEDLLDRIFASFCIGK